MRPASTKQSKSTPSSRQRRKLAAAQRPQHAAPRLKSRQPATAPGMPAEGGPHAAFDPDLRHRMISEAAFYLYTQRGDIDGFDLDDWLQAEAQIDDLIMNPEREDTLEVSAPLSSP